MIVCAVKTTHIVCQLKLALILIRSKEFAPIFKFARLDRLIVIVVFLKIIAYLKRIALLMINVLNFPFVKIVKQAAFVGKTKPFALNNNIALIQTWKKATALYLVVKITKQIVFVVKITNIVQKIKLAKGLNR